MTVLGFCTHFTQTDEWAFDYAWRLAQANNWQLNICHWLNSPYKLRRDIVQDDLFHPQHNIPVDPKLLTRLEYQLRAFYEPKLGELTNVAFRLCEGQYQVELVRCLRKNLLELVVMGFQPNEAELPGAENSLLAFAEKLPYPLVIIGHAGPHSFLINHSAVAWLDQLALPDGSWEEIEPERV